LRNWRRDMGLKMKVESDVVLPRDMLEKIAAAAPKTMEELAAVMDELPWRYQRFGEKIFNLIH
ncbi:MAG TPA: HRDC domain-containing protein, partial [Anaerolineaceae bacterium]|nr:HRDC domain-containing protein [Anaerolineaceae bacterium]